MNKPGKSSIFKTSLLVASLCAALGAQAAGVGKLSVYSAIGQPLNAEVALTATPEELNSLTARLASHEAFKEAGIDFASVLTGLRFSIAKSPSGQPILRLTTDAPLNEPFLHFLVELNWTSGRMVREYTFLLDPPEMLKAAKPASVVKPATPAIETTPLPLQPAKAAKPAKAAPTAAESAPKVPDAKAPAKMAAAEPGEEVRVKSGDTLSKIAREHMPETVTLDQMLVALFNTNREIFDGGNMNRLRAGKILRLPDPAEAAKVDPSEARKLIVSQAVDFNAYKRRLAAAAAAAPAPEAAPQQQVAGKIKPQVEEKVPPAPAKDKLEVSRTETAKTAKADGGKAVLEEELIARDKSLREASDRIAHLEKNLENLKQLAELKSESGAKIQQQAQAAATPAVPAAEKQTEPSGTKPSESPAAQPASPAAEPPVSPAPEQKPAESAPEAAKEPPPKPALKKAVPPPPPPPEPSFVEDNPELVFGGGGLIALLLGYLGYSAWRKKKLAKETEAELHEPPSSMRFEAEKPAEPSVAPSVAASTALEESDVSILGDFSSTEGALAAEGGVDPVAEADVLMAYGRDAQAEEILLEGLKADPQHAGIHAKLLELYANRQDKARFESTARDLHGISKGQGEAWDNAVKLAAGLGIAGGVFGAAGAASAGQALAEAAKVEAVPPAEVRPEPVTAEEIAHQAPPAEAEEDSLDFDLDLGTTTSMPAAIAAAEKAAAQAASEAALDFDFDLGTPEPSSQAEQAPAAPVAETPQTAAETGDSNVIDFSVDVGELSVPPVAEPEPAKAAAEDTNVLDFDLDLGSVEPGEEAASTEQPAAPALDLADISLDLGEPEAEQKAETALPDIDLDLGLDLGESPAAAEALPDLELPAGEAAPSTEIVAEEVDDPEVATKLELAQAYEEMGDHEGARELLNEVLNEGSAAQQEMARTRLDRLSA